MNTLTIDDSNYEQYKNYEIFYKNISIECSGNIEFPYLVNINGDLSIITNGDIICKKLVFIGGVLYLDQSSRLFIPKLSVINMVYLFSYSILEAPNLMEINGLLVIGESNKGNNFPTLQYINQLHFNGNSYLDAKELKYVHKLIGGKTSYLLCHDYHTIGETRNNDESADDDLVCVISDKIIKKFNLKYFASSDLKNIYY